MTAAAAPSELDEAIAVVETAIREGQTLTALEREPIMLALSRSTDGYGQTKLRAAIEQLDRVQSRVNAFDPGAAVAAAARADAERRRARIEHWKQLSGGERASFIMAAANGLGTRTTFSDLIAHAKLAADPSTADLDPPDLFEPRAR